MAEARSRWLDWEPPDSMPAPEIGTDNADNAVFSGDFPNIVSAVSAIPEDSEIIEAAVLVRSERYGEVWLALGPQISEELLAEEAARPLKARRPVLTVATVEALRGKSPAHVRVVLDAARVFGPVEVTQ